eukprot:scaffold20640_cov124-Isochrysis_galbana.AAC.5
MGTAAETPLLALTVYSVSGRPRRDSSTSANRNRRVAGSNGNSRYSAAGPVTGAWVVWPVARSIFRATSSDDSALLNSAYPREASADGAARGICGAGGPERRRRDSPCGRRVLWPGASIVVANSGPRNCQARAGSQQPTEPTSQPMDQRAQQLDV